MSAEKGINWPGLLKWSLSYSDGTTDTTPMSLERLRFLEAAMKEAMGSYDDPNDVVKEAVLKMRDEGSTDGDIINALQLIERSIDDAPEIARNLDKLGALEVLINRVNDTNPKISQGVLQILQFALPHNPAVQQRAWQLNCLRLLLLDEHQCLESHLRFGALSGLVRHAPNIEKDFIDQGGCKIIVAGLSSSNPKVQTKAANLLRHLFEESSIPPELALESDVGTSLAHMIDTSAVQHDDRGMQYHETVCAAIHAMLIGCEPLLRTHPESVAAQLSLLDTALRNRLSCLSESTDEERQRTMIEVSLQLIEKGQG